MTKLEIINETVHYYSEDPSRRACDPAKGSCFYKTNDGRMCAVGRCFNDEADFSSIVAVNRYAKEFDIESHFKPEYRGHEVDFWQDLQILHDLPHRWNDYGLTEDGKEYVKFITKKWTSTT